MSYIYEALKRAEDEREHGAVTVGTVARPLVFTPRARWWVWTLIGGLAVNAALLGALAIDRWARPPGAPSPVAAVVVPPAPVTAPPPPAVPVVRATPPPVVMPPPAVTRPRVATAPPPPRVATARPVVTAPPIVTTPRVMAPPVATATPTVTPRPRPQPSHVAPERARPTPAPAPAPPREREPVPIPPAPAEPRTSLTAPPQIATPVPSPAPVAPETAPDLKLQVHVYSLVASERMVFIAGRRYGEGDAIDADTVLERITPDGAVVRRRGQRFELSDRRR